MIIRTIVVLWVLCITLPTEVLGSDRRSSSALVNTYGVVSPFENMQVEQAHVVFDNLKKVIGVATSSARLLVVDSIGKPWAIASIDGNVVLSLGALEIIFSSGLDEISNARLAFVIGHELAHLATRDYWHDQVHQKLSGSTTNPQLQNIGDKIQLSLRDLESRKEIELRADESGFVYAALAGYKVSKILGNDRRSDSFLEIWVDQTATFLDNSHYRPATRTQFLRDRLKDLENQIAYFEYGKKFAHFGRFEDAEYLISEFNRNFPSRQGLNNAAYVKIQRARSLMPQSTAYRFWIPTLLEGDSGISTTRKSGKLVGQSLSNEDRQKNREVVRLLEESVETLERAKSLNPENMVVQVNLIASYYYLGKIGHARLTVDEAIKIFPQSPQSLQLRGLKAIILLEEDPSIDMWPIASRMLEKIAQQSDAPEHAIFNYAQLLIERRRFGKAEIYLEKLRKYQQFIPLVYRQLICMKSKNPDDCFDALKIDRSEIRSTKFSFKIGDDIDSRRSRKKLKNWKKLVLERDSFIFEILINDENSSVIAIDGLVEMLTIKYKSDYSVQKLIKKEGHPDKILRLGDDQVWTYGSEWAALVNNEQVIEAWVAK